MKSILIIFAVMLIVACGKTDKQHEHQHDMGAAMSESQEHDMSSMKGTHEHEGMHSDEPEIAADETLIYYTCPMDSHKDVHHTEPGKCEKCGMDLVAGVVTSVEKMDYYGCPMLMHSYIRQDKPGKCPECGMKLMPMRLVKQ